MQFKPFTSEQLAAYLNDIPAVRERLAEGELDVREIGDGNLNYVYIARNLHAPHAGVVVKQAPPFLRLVGADWPLTRERMARELDALRRFGACCPQHVPQVYHADNEQALIVMQHLSSHRVLRQELIAGGIFPRLADHLSTFLARTLFFGSDLYLAPEAKKEAARAAVNGELCRITEDLVFTHPFEDHPSNAYSAELPKEAINRLRTYEPLRLAAGQMKAAFMNHAQTLVHGDLHTGSIMVNADETYVIDPEFSFYGPMGFDVGNVLANLLLAYFAREWHNRMPACEPAAYQRWLIELIAQIWNGFANTFLALWLEHERKQGRAFIGGDADSPAAEAFRRDYLWQVFTDSLGFAGCEMIRRIVGMAKVADVTSIGDASVRALVEIRSLRMAEQLLVRRCEFASITEVTRLAAEVQSCAAATA